MDWYQVKHGVELFTGLDMDALHVHVGILAQIGVALLMRRSLASPWPWLVLLAAVLANEYYDITYEIWPSLTRREFRSVALQRLQLWLWAIGMMVMTIPWHFLGLQGQWRRVASFDYTDPTIAGWGPWVVVSLAGGVLLLVSAALFVWNLIPKRYSPGLDPAPTYAFALAAHPPHRVPKVLNGFALWNILVAVLMAAAYGYPILQFFLNDAPHAVIHPVTGG